jgi:hypothetical protein
MAEQTVRIEGTVPISSDAPLEITASTPLDVEPINSSATATTTLTAATTGTGTTVDFGTGTNDITMAILVTGTVTAGTVALDVSQDGTNWVMFSTSTLTTNTNTKLTSSAEVWRYARGRVTTNITGGATVTCTIMGWGH